ncbi:hypothetical protein Mapa_006153 [Marchantia paleacea]|nr:hypothetical protein Mapa_016835 [Marchantia paleacea]KAG6552300.1 hypothetical protein Mapa_006153 [Marchantia paleacea]
MFAHRSRLPRSKAPSSAPVVCSNETFCLRCFLRVPALYFQDFNICAGYFLSTELQIGIRNFDLLQARILLRHREPLFFPLRSQFLNLSRLRWPRFWVVVAESDL